MQKKLSAKQIKLLLATDPVAINFRDRIAYVDRVFGKPFTYRVEAEYQEYIDATYKYSVA